MTSDLETVRFEAAAPPLEALVPLYEAVGWTRYVEDPSGLERAVARSTFVLAAWQSARLIGLARALSDEASVWFLQDLLVHPDRQGHGIGSALMARCVERFADVRRGVLLTDPHGAERFYARHGWKAAGEMKMLALVREP